jgi:hypothetical protein
MRVIIKRILRKHGYPPDNLARATELVMEQAEVLCREWSGPALNPGGLGRILDRFQFDRKPTLLPKKLARSS